MIHMYNVIYCNIMCASATAPPFPSCCSKAADSKLFYTMLTVIRVIAIIRVIIAVIRVY